ncbi:MAG: hypothetical protein Q9210_005635 [Variospora velana]
MSFEQPTYSFSYPSGQPPTPTRTPTSATFPESFETLKQESSFYDPRTPKYLTFSTPLKSPNKSAGTRRPLPGQNIEEQIASHVHHLSPHPERTLPPVEPSRRLSSSPNPSSTSKRACHRTTETELTPLKTSLDEEAASSMRSAGSMQTPPPTSTTASRTRRVDNIPLAKKGKKSGMTQRRMSSPGRSRGGNTEQTAPLVEASPGFPSLQFSPELFNFPNAGPATAPVFPQTKLFWDDDQTQNAMSIDFSANDGFALGLGIDKNLDPFISTQDQGTPSRMPSASFQTLDGSQDDLAIFPVSAKVPAKKFSKSRLAANVVNPSMLFSSPGQSSDLPNLPTSQANIDSTLQPYAHQILDAEREIELLGPRKSRKRRGTEVDSPAVKEALATLRDDETDRLPPRRSITDTVLQSFDDTHVKAALKDRKAMEAQKQIAATRPQGARRLSPHKSVRGPSRRTRLTLTIDPTGRAKTESRVLEDAARPFSSSKMNVDSGTEEEDSSPTSDNIDIATSQRQSFGFAKKKANRGKLTRFALDSKTHSQRSSYASTFASSNTAGGVNPTKPQVMSNFSSHFDDPSLLPLPSSDDRASSSTVISDRLDGRDAQGSNTETTMESDGGQGDAQSELKKIQQQRQRRKTRQRQSPQFWGPEKARRGFEYPSLVPTNPIQPFPYSVGHDPFNISPTTITDPDLATPNSTRGSVVNSETTRCVCRVGDVDGGLMIQWYPFSPCGSDSCKKWLHVNCVGLNPRRVPEVYLCIFCTGNTPNVRGGRVREPQRALFPVTTAGSPLAHKSQRFR